MRTVELSLTSPVVNGIEPFLGLKENNSKNYVGVLKDTPFFAQINAPAYTPSWKDYLNFATVFSYGGKGITTNRLNAGGTAPINGGWGLNTATLTSANTDTALFDPSAEARVAGTFSQQTTNANVPNDTAQVVVTIQASATRAIMEFGLFDTATAASQTTLATTITSTAVTTITVASGTGFSNGNMAQINTEVVSITSGGTTATWTVGRGARGSTAQASAAVGAAVVGGEANAGGNMYMKGDFAVINLNSGDSVQFTSKVQYT